MSGSPLATPCTKLAAVGGGTTVEPPLLLPEVLLPLLPDVLLPLELLPLLLEVLPPELVELPPLVLLALPELLPLLVLLLPELLELPLLLPALLPLLELLLPDAGGGAPAMGDRLPLSAGCCCTVAGPATPAASQPCSIGSVAMPAAAVPAWRKKSRRVSRMRRCVARARMRLRNRWLALIGACRVVAGNRNGQAGAPSLKLRDELMT